MQQLRECQFSKAVALMRDSAHTIREVCRKANSSVNEAAPFSSRSYTLVFSCVECYIIFVHFSG